MKPTKDKPVKKPLTDAELAAKYDNGTSVDFDAALRKMGNAPSPTGKKKRLAADGK